AWAPLGVSLNSQLFSCCRIGSLFCCLIFRRMVYGTVDGVIPINIQIPDQQQHRALDTLRHRASPSFAISAITCSISRQSLDMAPPARSTSHEEAASTRRATLPRINRDTAFFP